MAAGLGFKDFTTGEVLTAADVDGYLMQGVWVFASAAARDAAVTSPQEGNFAYLKDTNVTTYYTGSAWANLDTTGMINPMTTTGDTIYSSSGSTPARLGIGSTGQVLTVAGGIPSWATPSASTTSYTLLNSGGTTLSGTSTTVSSLSGYNKIFAWVDGYSISSNGNMRFRLNSDTGSNYYAASGDGDPAAMTWITVIGGAVPYTADIFINVDAANSTSIKPVSGGGVTSTGSTGYFSGYYNGSSVISSITIIAGAGSFNGGKVYVYGAN